MTTSRLPLELASTAPHAARVRKEGIAAVPTTAIAPPFKNVRRVMLIVPLLPLKLRRTQQQPGDYVEVRGMRRIFELCHCLRVNDALFNRLMRLLGDVTWNQRLLKLKLHLIRISVGHRSSIEQLRKVESSAQQPVGRKRESEIHAIEKRR